eukprot:gnl/Spiro4/26022_TR12961_c0_g1_i1.p1 gnl/Spiro4/26022_TR12961_c0_g1~~gnl/Spiro4/26022_TR12961_c0_g1_i1.p1  ORF type:complete len:393 (+),score=64.83 gnl/Spiro4/26022_TR12961_c0_g1_i1:84-1262(+)
MTAEPAKAATPSTHGTPVQTVSVLLVTAISSFLTWGFFLPYLPAQMRLILTIVLGVCTVAVLVFLFLLIRSDPGYIPMGLPQEPPAKLKRVTEVSPGTVVSEKWCRFCHVWRGEGRTGHCHTCKRCVLRFDHHCAVLGACVGLGNYRFFILLLLFASVGSLLHFSISVVCVDKLLMDDVSWKNWQLPVAFVTCMLYGYCVPLSLFFCFHCSLLSCDVTTKERFGNQHKQLCAASCSGCCCSCVDVFCEPLRWVDFDSPGSGSSLVSTSPPGPGAPHEEVMPLVSTPPTPPYGGVSLSAPTAPSDIPADSCNCCSPRASVSVVVDTDSPAFTLALLQKSLLNEQQQQKQQQLDERLEHDLERGESLPLVVDSPHLALPSQAPAATTPNPSTPR